MLRPHRAGELYKTHGHVRAMLLERRITLKAAQTTPANDRTSTEIALVEFAGLLCSYSGSSVPSDFALASSYTRGAVAMSSIAIPRLTHNVR